MYSVIQITALTDKHISVLLTDDLAVEIDREAFEEYVAPEGMYEYNQVVEVGPHQYDTISGLMDIADYWDEYETNDIPVIADLNDFISQSVSTKLDIDVVRAWENIRQELDPLWFDDKISHLLMNYGTAKYNQGKNENL